MQYYQKHRELILQRYHNIPKNRVVCDLCHIELNESNFKAHCKSETHLQIKDMIQDYIMLRQQLDKQYFEKNNIEINKK